jgi:protein CWC15
MTTAHKPTFHPAVGGEHQGSSRSYVPSQAYSSRDQPSHTKLKFRFLSIKIKYDFFEFIFE